MPLPLKRCLLLSESAAIGPSDLGLSLLAAATPEIVFSMSAVTCLNPDHDERRWAQISATGL